MTIDQEKSAHLLVLLTILMVLTIYTNNSSAGIYKWTDDIGVIHYSENKPDEIAVEEFKLQSYKSVTILDNNDSDGEESNESIKKKSILRPKRVVMYSAEWCGVCKQAKKYFKENKIRYSNYDIEKSKSAKARFKKFGAKGIPVILVGKKRMNGFSVVGFNQVYKK